MKNDLTDCRACLIAQRSTATAAAKKGYVDYPFIRPPSNRTHLKRPPGAPKSILNCRRAQIRLKNQHITLCKCQQFIHDHADLGLKITRPWPDHVNRHFSPGAGASGTGTNEPCSTDVCTQPSGQLRQAAPGKGQVQ